MFNLHHVTFAQFATVASANERCRC